MEFALESLAFYLLLAATIDLGRLIFMAQAVQDVARVAARELALSPVLATATFEEALLDPGVQQRVFDARYLVMDLDQFATEEQRDTCYGSLPLVNKALRPLMVVDRVTIADVERTLLRFPGALLSVEMPPPAPTNPACPEATIPTDLTVGIPRVTARGDEGVETIEWTPVLEEVRTDPVDPATGAFSLTSTAVAPGEAGTVALRVNVPFQGGLLIGFQAESTDPFAPNLDNPITANDAGVTEAAAPGSPLPLNQTAGVFAGPYGLGRQLAYGRTVRPFRRLLAAQSVYRREVFQ